MRMWILVCLPATYGQHVILARLIQFVFPSNAEVPVTLQYKIRLHEQLAELVADRYGYMAVENLDVCVTAFFKMASGLDLVKMNVSIEALLADNNRRLEYFLKDKGMSRASHPVNPIRVLNFADCGARHQFVRGNLVMRTRANRPYE